MNKLKHLFPDNDKQRKNKMLERGVSKLQSHIRSARERESEGETCYGQRLMRESIPLVVQGILEWFKAQTKSPVPSVAYEELSKIDPKVSAYIAVKSIVDSLSQRRSLASASIRLGALIEDELRFRKFSDHPKWNQILRGASKRTGYKKKRYYIIHSEKGEIEKDNAEIWEPWRNRTKAHIGTVLITIIKDRTGLVDYVKVSDQTKKYHSQRYIVATKKTVEWIDNMIKHNQILKPFWMPLTEFPKQWDNLWSGGYDEEYGLPPLPFIKVRNKKFLRTTKEPMTDVMKAVNYLQNTSFVVNPKAFEFFNSVVENDIELGDMPKRDDEEIPLFPSESEQNKNPNAVRDWKRRASAIYQLNTSTKSRRILVLNTLGLAKEFLGKRMYLPHQCDFRGRVYAVPSYLNHMGTDFAKSLMTFEQGVPCYTDADKRWLLIHGANCFGVKGTFSQRLDWIWDNKDNIIETGKNPINCIDFLRQASEPFQFVAFADEFVRMLKQGSNFVTHLPCQMDASNNGLQILGMLMRDRSSCEATNVANNSEPKDIYQMVADEAIRSLRFESNVNPYAKLWLKFGVTRGCAKRPCMTQPYGSTPHSCRNYVNEWYLDSVRVEGKPDPFTEDNRFKATAYLSSKIWDAINIVVGKPREAMAWLQNCAKVLADENIPMTWVSPSGFHVMQDYNKMEENNIRTKIGDKVYKVSFKEDAGVLSSKRQAQGSSPNFVHSLDSACMHLTVNKLGGSGVKSFAMVHDSYGTHSSNCDLMAHYIRETIYRIFELDQLGILRNNLESSLTSRTSKRLPELPEYGSFDIKEVLDSKYIFS